MREIILDTETTGFDPHTGHKIIEIGCIELIDRKEIGNSFQVYINPQRDVPEESFKIHGISTESLKDKPVFKEIIEAFLDFIKGDVLVIHNADFDVNFLNYELALVGKEKISFDRTIDTLTMARKKFPGQSNTLDALCDRFSIDRERRTKHGALVDVELLAEVYMQLCKESESLKLAVENKKRIPNTTKKERFERIFDIPTNDLENHNNLVNKLKNPLWKSCIKDTV